MDKKERSSKWGLLLYPEDPIHKQAFENLIENDGIQWNIAYINHNKDIYEPDSEKAGEIKKEHIHIVLNSKSQIWNTALAKQLNIPINYLQRIRNYENALEYLIHYKDEDKHLYDIDEVKGSLANKLREIIAKDGKCEGERVLDIIDYIESCRYITIKEFSCWVANNGYWDVFRRSASIFILMINEHNEIYKIKL